MEWTLSSKAWRATLSTDPAGAGSYSLTKKRWPGALKGLLNLSRQYQAMLDALTKGRITEDCKKERESGEREKGNVDQSSSKAPHND